MAQVIQFEGQQHSFPDDFSSDEISAALASAPPITQPNVAGDVAKQAGVGLLSGVEGIPSAIPRILNAAGTALTPTIESMVSKFSPAKAAEMHQAEADRQAFMAANKPPSITDNLPQPQTEAGQLTRAGASFIPGMLGAPGNLIKNAIVGAGAGVASEGAGQATEGTAAEPYARIGAALLAGGAGAKALAPSAAKLVPKDLIDAGSAAYKSPEVMAVQIKPQAAQTISDNIAGELNKSRLNARLAPQTHAIVEDLATPVNGPNHSLEDFQTVRTLLGKQAGNFSNPTEQAAASKAIELLDKHLAGMPQTDLLAGDIAKANTTLTAGRGDYAAGKAAERVQGKLDNAELQAASAHSGGNIDNATRQKLRTILTSPNQSRGLTPEELGSIDQVVRGSPTGNVLRATGKVLGGGGGLGSLVSAAEGMHVAGPIGAAAPVAGYGIKKLGDLLTARAADRAVQQILSRAPSAAALRPGAPASLPPSIGGLAGALMASQPQSEKKPAPLSSLPFALRWSQGQPNLPPVSR